MYTSQVSSVTLEPLSARPSLHTSTKKSRTVFKSSGLSKSFSASPGVQHTSRIVEQADGYVLESTGSPLPVLVTEVLTSPEKSTEPSVGVSECGWTWLVSGRRLLVWRYGASTGPPDAHRRVSLCRELTLPPSDLAHRAQLVQILGGSDTHVPSCLAASPEGALRFWPSIIHESCSTECSTNLQGQECERLVSLGDAGCLLATTTSTLVLVTWRDGLVCRRLSAAAGLLGGISRRVSSLIWGAMQTAGAEEPLVSLRACAQDGDVSGATAYLLTERRLQRWWVDTSAAAGLADRTEFEADLDRLARDSFLHTVWSRDTTSADQLEVSLRDLWVTSHGLHVLITACNPPQSGTLFFALGTLDDCGTDAPVQWSRFDILRSTISAEEGDPGPLRLLAAGDSLFILHERQITCVNLASPGDSVDTVRLTAPGERIIGWGLAGDATPLLFTKGHGLLRLTVRGGHPDPGQTTNLSVLGLDYTSAVSQSFNISLSQVELDEATSSGDPKAKLRAAWILFCQNDLTHCSSLVEAAFPRPLPAGHHSDLDTVVVQLSGDIIDDYPASDPRWAESASHEATLSTTSSLILLHQLDEKRQRHRLFIEFLRATALWDQLTALSSGDAVVATSEVLQEHQEKVVAAMALTNQAAQLGAVVDAAVCRVIEQRGETPLRPLTAQDLFFRRLSDLHELLPALLQLEQEQLQQAAARQLQLLVSETNAVLLVMLRAVETARRESGPQPPGAPAERQPWSSAAAARPLLISQYQLTQQHALPAAEPGAARTALYQQMLELADVILGGYREQLGSLRGTQRAAAVQSRFEEDRYSLIRPLVDAEQYERACSLAEKYADFRTLVEVCELTNSPARRNKYLTQFADQGFAGFVFNWYLERGQRSQLLSQCGRAEFAEFLSEYRGLRWLNELEAGRYTSAADTLMHCAQAETMYLTRKKTYLSLAKLCALAGTHGHELGTRLEKLQPSMELVLLQEQLPAAVLEAHGIDAETMHVLSARELILLYVSPENVDANEVDFVRALALAEWCTAAADAGAREDGEAGDQLLLEVWCRAVLRDDWRHRHTDHPVTSCADTLFMRTVQMLSMSGRRAPLPAPDRLLACEQLAELAADPSFTFLIKALYEHVTRLDEEEFMEQW